MFYVVYIDILFLVNFFMDFIVLTATGTILKIRTGILRRTLGAALGATCYCTTLYLPWENREYAGRIMMFLAACVMGILVFSIRRIWKLCRFLLVFHASAFFLGGTVTAVYYNTRLGYYIRKAVKGDLHAQLLAGLSAFLVLIACILGRLMLACIRQRQREGQLYYEIELCQGNRRKKAKALLDTGNHLKEPVSRKPVILMDMACAGELLDEGLIKAVGEFYATGAMGEAGEGMSVIRLVPYHSVGKSHGMLAAVRLDSLSIRKGDEVIEAAGVYAAITGEPLSSRGEYQVLLNAELAAFWGE